MQLTKWGLVLRSWWRMITENILALLPGVGTKPRGLPVIYGSFIRPTQL